MSLQDSGLLSAQPKDQTALQGSLMVSPFPPIFTPATGSQTPI